MQLFSIWCMSKLVSLASSVDEADFCLPRYSLTSSTKQPFILYPNTRGLFLQSSATCTLCITLSKDLATQICTNFISSMELSCVTDQITFPSTVLQLSNRSTVTKSTSRRVAGTNHSTVSASSTPSTKMYTPGRNVSCHKLSRTKPCEGWNPISSLPYVIGVRLLVRMRISIWHRQSEDGRPRKIWHTGPRT